MVTISIGTGFVVYLMLMLGLLAAVSIIESWRGRTHHWTISEEQVGQCNGCGYSFVVRRSETVARCPRCGNLCPMRRKT